MVSGTKPNKLIPTMRQGSVVTFAPGTNGEGSINASYERVIRKRKRKSTD